MNYRQMAVFLMICGLQILVGNWVGAKGYASGAAAAAFVEATCVMRMDEETASSGE